MADYEICCPHCLNNLQFPDTMLGDNIQCPECSHALELAAPPAILAPAETVEEAPVENAYEPEVNPETAYNQEPEPYSQPEAPAAYTEPAIEPEVIEQLPERMKANKKVLGRTCIVCNVPIELGDDLHNCQECNSTMHAACYEKANACGNPDCSKYALTPIPTQKPKLALKKNTAPKTGGAIHGATKPCKYCGEAIAAVAKKCRYCGEFQSELDHKLQKQRQQSGSTDDDLQWWEILLAIFCGTIGCILGIVYICQGKKKGTKLLLISIVCNVIFGAIRAMLSS